MIASFFLSLREMLEAALIVGIVLGALRKVDRRDLNRYVWLGVFSAAAVSLLAGWALNALHVSLEGNAEQWFEGVAMIVATGILTWVLVWVQQEGGALRENLEGGTIRNVLAGNGLALFFLAFTAVVREGIELSIFLTAASIETDLLSTLLGAGLGLLAALAAGWLIFSSTIRLSPRGFFTVTSVILILFAAGLVAHGVHEFNEIGIIPSIAAPVWDFSAILPEQSAAGQILKALFGYNADPSLTEAVAYGIYLLLVGVWMIWKRKR
ncbi:MAG: FTR1 family protein [Anaerolineales bacterium]|nr:FTR1 family protein [Anaerolineales bacterium]